VTPRHAVAVIAIAALPLLVASALARGLLGGSLVDSVPYVSDEIAYWTQIAAFDATGFGGGYTTVDERPARAAFTHFGPEGPGFPVVYGLAAKVVGWRYASGPVFGAVAFFAGACAWLLLARPRLIGAALVLGTFWPVVLAAPNTMQEPLHFAIGCALAALVGATLRDEAPSRARVWTTWGLLATAALVRPTWALVAVGFAWQRSRRSGSKWGAWGVVAGVAICLGLYAALAWMSAPYPRATSGLDLINRGPVGAVTAVLTALGHWRRWLFGDAEPLERFFRFEVLVVALLATASALRGVDGTARRVMATMAASMWILIAANLALENVGAWQDYRATAPVLLMTLLAATAIRARWAWAVVAAHLVVTPQAIATFRDFHEPRWEHGSRVDAIDRFGASIRPHVRFDPALTGWGNTLLVSVARYDYPLMGVPPGIGLSVTFDWGGVPSPPRSRYVLLGPDEIAAAATRIRLRKLADTPMGGLYENEDWTRAAP
jgi:hypothetical protein